MVCIVVYNVIKYYCEDKSSGILFTLALSSLFPLSLSVPFPPFLCFLSSSLSSLSSLLVPEAINSVSFTTYSNNQSVALDWSNTFRLNSVLSHFIVIRDGFFLLQGTQTYAVFGNQPIGRRK